MSGQARRSINQNTTARTAFALFGCLVLLITYLFQQTDFLSGICSVIFSNGCQFQPTIIFVVNKTLRLIVNDAACMLLIVAIFREQKYLRVAFYIFLFELLIMLPIYFTCKLTVEGTSEISSPLLSQVHRMIINPMLMILTIIAFFYQRFKAGENTAV